MRSEDHPAPHEAIFDFASQAISELIPREVTPAVEINAKTNTEKEERIAREMGLSDFREIGRRPRTPRPLCRESSRAREIPNSPPPSSPPEGPRSAPSLTAPPTLAEFRHMISHYRTLRPSTTRLKEPLATDSSMVEEIEVPETEHVLAPTHRDEVEIAMRRDTLRQARRFRMHSQLKSHVS